MTGRRWLHVRLCRLERALGVHQGRRMPCPTCDGTGLEYPLDGEHMGWEIRRVMADVHERFRDVALFDPDPLPSEPDEAKVRCSSCDGTGVTTVEAIEARRDPAAGERLKAKLLEVADRLRRTIDL